MASQKAIDRHAKFGKLGAAISALKPKTVYDDRDYHTGKASKFRMARADAHNRDEQECEGRGTEIPLGPAFKTPQWIRTVR